MILFTSFSWSLVSELSPCRHMIKKTRKYVTKWSNQIISFSGERNFFASYLCTKLYYFHFYWPIQCCILHWRLIKERKCTYKSDSLYVYFHFETDLRKLFRIFSKNNFLYIIQYWLKFPSCSSCTSACLHDLQLISIILISAVTTTNVRVRMLFTVINSKTTEQQEIKTREILTYFVFINKTFCEVFMEDKTLLGGMTRQKRNIQR